MKKVITLVGALAAVAFAIAPLVTNLSARAGAIISIIGVGAAAFGPALTGPRGFKLKTIRRATIKRSYRSFAILIAPLFCLVMLTGCPSAKGIYVLASGMDEGITIKRELGTQGQITSEVELSITRGMLDVNRTLLQLTDTAKCFESFTSEVKEALIQRVDDSIRMIDSLNEQGVLHIKSEQARRRYTQWMSGVRLAAFGLRTTLNLVSAKDPVVEGQPVTPLTEKELKALDDLRRTCRQASELLRRNDTRLQEDLTRLELPPATN